MPEDLIDLDGGQTRMEAAYGSDDGDEDLFAITAKREASVGEIFRTKLSAMGWRFWATLGKKLCNL